MTAGSDTERDRTTASERRSASAGQESAFFDDVGARVVELRKELHDYLAIKIARLKLSFFEGVVSAVMAILGVVFAATFVATAVVFVFSGFAGWLGEVTSRPYLGALLTGVIGLLLVGVALLVGRAVLLKRVARKKDASACE